jgi:hypothetical protein
MTSTQYDAAIQARRQQLYGNSAQYPSAVKSDGMDIAKGRIRYQCSRGAFDNLTETKKNAAIKYSQIT